VVSVFVSTHSATPSPTSAPAIVRVTISPDLLITFSPKTFKRGTIVFKITNRNNRAHSFMINGVTTKVINPNATLSARVTFKQPSIYTAALPDCGYLSRCPERPDTGAIGSVKVT
jgi:hypothetical protein